MNQAIAVMKKSLAQRVWYWTFGGIWECAKAAFDLRNQAAFEFCTSGFLLLMGVWILIPHDFSDGMAFSATIAHVVPVWTFAALAIIVSRVMIHLTLRGSDKCRSWGLMAVAFTWGLMAYFNLLSGKIEVGTPIFIFAVLLTIGLQLRMDAKIYADKALKARQAEAKNMLQTN